MSPPTVSLSLLRYACGLYWCPEIDIYVFENRVTVQGDGLFLYSATLPKSFSYPFVTKDIRELYDHVNCKAKLTFSDAAKREHIMPIDWLSDNGYGPVSGPPPSIYLRQPTTLFVSRRPGASQGFLFEDGAEQLAIVMSANAQCFIGE